MALTSVAVLSFMTFSTRASASALVHWEMMRRVRRMDGAETENSPRPKEINTGMSSGSAAASPHMPTMMPALLPSSMMRLRERRTAGWYTS